MYSNVYAIENLSRQIVSDRHQEARTLSRVRLAEIVRRSLRLEAQPKASQATSVPAAS